MKENFHLNRDSAWALLNEYTKSSSLLKHALAVEAAMLFYADLGGISGEERLMWGITGLLHDFDYEMYPNVGPDGHPAKGREILTELGYPAALTEAIMGHATDSGVPRVSQMAKTLFAVDELSGLVTATVLVRPEKKIAGLESKSVTKRMKDKAFARGVNREHIIQGAAELGVELDPHVKNVISALQGISEQLGL